MALPNPGMSFSPFAILTAEEMNDLVENIESLADGSGFDAGAIGTADIADQAVTNSKLSTSTGELGGAWIDISGTSTIVGWSSRTLTAIRYTRIGKSILVIFQIDGTSNSTSVTFTLPFNTQNLLSINNDFPVPLAINNGSVSSSGGRGSIPSNSNIVTLFSNLSGSGWTASGSKAVRGQFILESA